MRRMALIPRIPSWPSMSHLMKDYRPLHPTPSNLSDRFPRRPYYRFYYAAVASDVSGAAETLWEASDLDRVFLVDLDDLVQ